MQHSGNTHIFQASHYLDNEKRLYIASEFIKSAMWHMNKNLIEYNIGIPPDVMDTYYKSLDSCVTTNEIMGIEGNFRKKYYENFDIIIKKFKFVKRSKRPPLNEINALISFGNSLCYNYCLNAIKQTYLNSTISFLHECGDRRHSLSLDLAEIFKPIIIDRIIFKLINNSSLKSCHFDLHDTFCLLKEDGKKIFIKEIEDKLNTTFFHRKMNKNVSYKSLIKYEAYKLCKHIMGVEKYEALKMNW
jgi:CRISPR-associated protein Cas1